MATEKKERFYTALHRLLRSVKGRTIVVIGGDLNAHLGPDQIQSLIGPHGHDEADNGNGEKLRDFAIAHDLVVLNRNGSPCKRSRSTSTFFGGSRKGRMIDYAFCSRRAGCHFTRPARTNWSLPIRRAGKKDDHRPVIWGIRRAVLFPRRKLKRKNRQYCSVRWDKRKLGKVVEEVRHAQFQNKDGTDRKEPKEAGELLTQVKKRIDSLGEWPRTNLDTTQRTLNQAVFEGGKEVFELKGLRPQRDFMYEDTWRMVQDKIEAVQATNTIRSTYGPAFWVAFYWSFVSHDADITGDNYWPAVATRVFFQIWRCQSDEERLDRGSTKLTVRDRVWGLERIAKNVEESDMEHKARVVAEGINKLAPKASQTRSALKNKDGTYCLDATEELEIYGEHICQLFGATEKCEDFEDLDDLPEAEGADESDADPFSKFSDLLLQVPHVAIYVDGSCMNRGHYAKAGWGFLALLVFGETRILIHIEAGPVVTSPSSPLYEGGEGHSNNVAEGTGQLEVHRWARKTIHEKVPVVVRYDSAYANDITTGTYRAKSNRLLAAKMRGGHAAHYEQRVTLESRHVRGHAKEQYNDMVDGIAKMGVDLTRDIKWTLHPPPYHIFREAFPAHPPFKVHDTPSTDVSVTSSDDEALPSGQQNEEEESSQESSLGDYSICFSELDLGGSSSSGQADASQGEYDVNDPLGPDYEEEEHDNSQNPFSAEGGLTPRARHIKQAQDCEMPADWEPPEQSVGEWMHKDIGFVKRCIMAPTRNKACSNGSPPAEVFQIILNFILPCVSTVVQLMQLMKQWPADWKNGWVVWLRKATGDGSDPGHYRTIMKLAALGKGYSTQLAKYLLTLFERIAPATFFGHLPHKSTLHAILCLDEIIRRFVKRSRRALRRGFSHLSLAAIFIDLTKFFDRIPREKLWAVVMQLLPEATAVVLELREMHGGTEYILTGPEGAIRRFTVDAGVRQGSSEGPVLAIILYAAILMQLREERVLFEWWIGLVAPVPSTDEMTHRTLSMQTAHRAVQAQHEAVDLSEIVFADDAVAFLLFFSLAQISSYLWLWHMVMTAFDMIINFKKTEIMLFWQTRALAKKWRHLKGIKVCSPTRAARLYPEDADYGVYQLSTDEPRKKNQDASQPISRTKTRDKRRNVQPAEAVVEGDTVDPEEVEFVVECVTFLKYLGVFVDLSWGVTMEVSTRISKAAGAFARLSRRVWRCRIIPQELKLRIYITLVLSILLYGIAARVLTKTQMNRLEVWHVRSVRRILRKPAYMTRETHTQTLKDAGVHTILSTVRRQRLVLWQAILLFDCLVAVRACVWGPLPWEHPSGHLETPRLRQLCEDLTFFLNRTGTNTAGWGSHRIVQEGIHKLRGAKKKHIDQVLNYDCSHLGERQGLLLSEEGGNDTTTCDICQKTCKGERGLRMHRIKTHGL